VPVQELWVPARTQVLVPVPVLVLPQVPVPVLVLVPVLVAASAHRIRLQAVQGQGLEEEGQRRAPNQIQGIFLSSSLLLVSGKWVWKWNGFVVDDRIGERLTIGFAVRELLASGGGHAREACVTQNALIAGLLFGNRDVAGALGGAHGDTFLCAI
jgi:hypothetical protein